MNDITTPQNERVKLLRLLQLLQPRRISRQKHERIAVVARAGTTHVEDRVRFLADLTDIFAELQIPWQHWFMIMDPELGTIDPQLQTALGLD